MSDTESTPKAPLKFPTEYWMVTASWDEILEVPREDGIVGETRRMVRKQKANQTIPVHPVIHGLIMLQNGFQNFTIDFALPISKRYYDLVNGPSTQGEKDVEGITAKIESESKDDPSPPSPGEESIQGSDITGGL